MYAAMHFIWDYMLLMYMYVNGACKARVSRSSSLPRKFVSAWLRYCYVFYCALHEYITCVTTEYNMYMYVVMLESYLLQ